jgi:hypothetical protein
VADAIEKDLGVKTDLVYGNRGEFSVLVNGDLVAKKGLFLFPPVKKVIAAVKDKLALAK